MQHNSPNPARFMAGGASAMMPRSTIRTSGQRDGTVRLTPSRRSTAMSSEKALTETAVCTTTKGRLPARIEASLAMSVIVPEPTRPRSRRRRSPHRPGEAAASVWSSAPSAVMTATPGIEGLPEVRRNRALMSLPARRIGVSSTMMTTGAGTPDGGHGGDQPVERVGTEADAAEADRPAPRVAVDGQAGAGDRRGRSGPGGRSQRALIRGTDSNSARRHRTGRGSGRRHRHRPRRVAGSGS